MNLLPQNLNFNFIKYSKYSYIFSLFLILIGLVYFFTSGIKTSIDFTGGTIVDCSVHKDKYDITELRNHLKENIDDNISVVENDSENNYYKIILTMKFLEDEEKLESSLHAIYNDDYEINMVESIGPKIGDELTKNAINAILAAMLLIGIYITIRFDGYYALGSLIALIHDIAITFSCLLIFQYEISISIVAALLTIVGYSLNDTIVIYDRIRENLKLNTKVERSIIVNKSLNMTLNRTIITSLTTLIVALVLFIMGGNVLEPFAMALIIGVLTGTYSSLFIATPIMLALEKKYKLDDLEEE